MQLFFRGDRPYARRGAEEWPIGDVRRTEMLFSPDGSRFAFVRDKARAGKQLPHVVVRNLAGDPVNEFAVYRPGPLQNLSWVDNRRLGYISAPSPGASKPTEVYVVHDAQTGEVLVARTGSDFIWGPERRHVAFVTGGSTTKQVVVVDGNNVWPRRGVTRLHGEPVWSPDGRGLALVDTGGAAPRLVVLVEYEDPEGDLSWPIPRGALSPGLGLFWAGDSKVVIGETALRPKFAAGWERLR